MGETLSFVSPLFCSPHPPDRLISLGPVPKALLKTKHKTKHRSLVEVWVYSLPPGFRLFTAFSHVPDHSKAQTTSHKTYRCVALQQAGKKEEVAGAMLDSAFHLISGCRIHKNQSEIRDQRTWEQAADMTTALLVTLVLLLFPIFLHSLFFLGVSL